MTERATPLAIEAARLEQARRAMLRGSLRKSREVLNHNMPQNEKGLLNALITPGICETVPFKDRVKASVKGRRFINPPIGWAINYEEPWQLTDVGIMALMEPGEIDKIHAELSRHDQPRNLGSPARPRVGRHRAGSGIERGD